MADSLIVCDVDFDSVACKIKEYWKLEDEILKELLSILTKVENQGVSQGRLHDCVSILKESVKTNYDFSKDQGSVVLSTVWDFLDRIDDIDLELYGG